MKITMLGTSGSGKTTYMSAMAALFFHGAVEGYTISSREHDYRKNALVFTQFNEIGTLYDSGNFPDGTATSTIMPLKLNYRGEHIIDIDWIDYRGGAIDELAQGNIDSAQNSDLQAILYASDVILVFIDSVKLKDCKSDLVARGKVGANQINEVLKKTNKNHKNVIFLLSKADSSEIDLEEDYDMLRKRVGKLYEVLLNNSGTDISQYTVIPIGAVGIGNVETTTVTQKDGDRDVKIFKHKIIDMDNINPFNIASSFAYALLKCVDLQVTELEEDVKYRDKKIKELKNNSKGIKNLIDVVFYHSKTREEIKDLNDVLMEKKDEIIALQPQRDRLQKIINNNL